MHCSCRYSALASLIQTSVCTLLLMVQMASLGLSLIATNNHRFGAYMMSFVPLHRDGRICTSKIRWCAKMHEHNTIAFWTKHNTIAVAELFCVHVCVHSGDHGHHGSLYPGVSSSLVPSLAYAALAWVAGVLIGGTAYCNMHEHCQISTTASPTRSRCGVLHVKFEDHKGWVSYMHIGIALESGGLILATWWIHWSIFVLLQSDVQKFVSNCVRQTLKWAPGWWYSCFIFP